MWKLYFYKINKCSEGETKLILISVRSTLTNDLISCLVEVKNLWAKYFPLEKLVK